MTKITIQEHELDFFRILQIANNNRIPPFIIFRDLCKTLSHKTNNSKLLLGFVDFLNIAGGNIRSQLLQDAFAAFIVDNRFEKSFLEFGATDGVSLSNTYFLERELGWKGVLCEPSPQWQARLTENRKGAKILTDCIWTETGKTLDFFVSLAGVLSTLSSYRESDRESIPRNAELRNEAGDTVKVTTISLNDVMDRCFDGVAPSYVSIDTEGSELDILDAFDFGRYRPVVWTVEHNFTEAQEKIDYLMESNGYRRVFRNLTVFDAWYVDETALAQMPLS